jgi:hypothetical protein
MEAKVTDNVAVLDGFTESVIATSSGCELFLLVRPGTDFDDCFKAWDTDGQEFIRVNGWLFTVERAS